jgi:hypothetical protein
MDPDAALKEMRALVEEVLHDNNPSEEAAERLSELVEGLDGWISRGGFLPTAWQPKQPRRDSDEQRFAWKIIDTVVRGTKERLLDWLLDDEEKHGTTLLCDMMEEGGVVLRVKFDTYTPVGDPLDDLRFERTLLHPEEEDD